MNSLGKYIKSERKKLNCSFRTLSEMSGLSHSYIEKLEKGIDIRTGKPIMPTLDALHKLSVAFDVPLHNLIEANGYSMSEDDTNQRIKKHSNDHAPIISIDSQIRKIIANLNNSDLLLVLQNNEISPTTRLLLAHSLESLLDLAEEINKLDKNDL